MWKWKNKLKTLFPLKKAPMKSSRVLKTSFKTHLLAKVVFVFLVFYFRSYFYLDGLDLPENPPASTPLVPETVQDKDDDTAAKVLKRELDELATRVDNKFEELSEHLKLIIGQVGDKDVPKIDEVIFAVWLFFITKI